MRKIDQNSVIMNTDISTFNTHVFSVIYADGTGIQSKINIGDKILIKALYDNQLISIEGVFSKFESDIIYVIADNNLYKIKYSNLVYIYNETTIKYNTEITNYTVSEEVTIPEDLNPPPSPSIVLSNSGTGVSLLSQVASNNFNIRSLKSGEGIDISTDGSTITIKNTLENMQVMTDQEVSDFIETYLK